MPSSTTDVEYTLRVTDTEDATGSTTLFAVRNGTDDTFDFSNLNTDTANGRTDAGLFSGGWDGVALDARGAQVGLTPGGDTEAQGDTLVHIEADDGFDTPPIDTTFDYDFIA